VDRVALTRAAQVHRALHLHLLHDRGQELERLALAVVGRLQIGHALAAAAATLVAFGLVSARVGVRLGQRRVVRIFFLPRVVVELGVIAHGSCLSVAELGSVSLDLALRRKLLFAFAFGLGGVADD